MIKILFIGDIVGKSGRNVVFDNISSLRNKHNIDLTIANAENSAHGKGISEKIYNQLIEAGVDVVTMGNHTFSKLTIFNFINKADKMVRPINMEPIDVGNNFLTVEVKGYKFCIYNILGNVFMDKALDSCFQITEELLAEVEADFYLCDFHGEATSEKIAYAYNFKDRLHAVIGTHTHVQTADERIIGNLGFITDVGMCGAYDSVLGREIEETLNKVVRNKKTSYTIAEGDGIFCGVILTLDELTRKAIDIERIQIKPTY